MANPFLVLGGIAISVATAAFGILQVPGWVASAQDAAAVNDIAQITAAQSVALSENGTFLRSMGALMEKSSAKVTPSAGVRTYTATDPTGKHCLALARSTSGVYFARLSEGGPVASGDTAHAAITNAGTTIAGGRTAEGVTVPEEHPDGWVVARNYAINPLATSLEGFRSHANSQLEVINDFPGEINTAIRSLQRGFGENRWIEVVGGSDLSFGEPLRFTATIRASMPMTLDFSVRTQTNEPASRVAEDQTIDIPAGITDIDLVFSTVDAVAAYRSGVTVRSEGITTFGATLDFTRISITKVGTDVGFFHGDSGTVGGAEARWAGEPGRSQSILLL